MQPQLSARTLAPASSQRSLTPSGSLKSLASTTPVIPGLRVPIVRDEKAQASARAQSARRASASARTTPVPPRDPAKEAAEKAAAEEAAKKRAAEQAQAHLEKLQTEKAEKEVKLIEEARVQHEKAIAEKEAQERAYKMELWDKYQSTTVTCGREDCAQSFRRKDNSDTACRYHNGMFVVRSFKPLEGYWRCCDPGTHSTVLLLLLLSRFGNGLQRSRSIQ